MRDGFRIFDAHTHIGTALHSGRRRTADELLAVMDRHGVDRALAIPFPVVADYRREHDEIGRALREHPERFAGAACLNPFVGEAAFREEVRRCVETWGFTALKLQPQYQPLNPISPRSEFFFETALEHRLTVVCHTGAGAPYALPSLFIIPARKFPTLPIVLAHSGGGIYAAEAIVAATVCPNIHLELSSLMPHHITEVLAHVPASRLQVGSDLPESIETEIGKIVQMQLSPEDKQEILWNNPCRLFGGGSA